MQISAINSNSNNFKGYTNVVDLTQNEQGTYTCDTPGFLDKLDSVDFSKIADSVNNDEPESKKTSPAKFFATSALLAAASFFAAKKVSVSALKTIEKKLSLEKPLNNLGAKIGEKMSALKGRPTPDIKGVKTFFTTNTNKALNAIAEGFESISKKGVTEAEKHRFFEVMGSKAKDSALYAKNGFYKFVSTLLGLGPAGMVIASRYKDADNNGIPDRLELNNGFSLLKDCQEALPKIASCCEFIS